MSAVKIFQDGDADVLLIGSVHKEGKSYAAVSHALRPGHTFYGISASQAPAVCREIYVASGLIWPLISDEDPLVETRGTGATHGAGRDGVPMLPVPSLREPSPELSALKTALEGLRSERASQWENRGRGIADTVEGLALQNVFMAAERAGLLTDETMQGKAPLEAAEAILLRLLGDEAVQDFELREALAAIRRERASP
jgi:hypothetical protein